MGLLEGLGKLLGKKEREAVFPYQQGYKPAAPTNPAAAAPSAGPASSGTAPAGAASSAPASPAAAQGAPAPAASSFVSLGSMGLEAAQAPKRRGVVQAPATVATLGASVSDAAPDDPAAIRIKAEPQASGEVCKFMVNRPVFASRSWIFTGGGLAQGSPLAEKLFALDGVDAVLIDDSVVVVTRKTKDGDWKALAAEVGRVLRSHLEAGESAVSEEIVSKIPPESEIRDQIQRVIDLEVNPGVAAHSGHISLTAVRGNSVYIKMGGGCQGCSAADLTLKEGIHRSFRTAVPYVGAIYDETDHKAGLNPYFR